MDKIKVKVRPAGTHAKIQYEGEELTIKELVGNLEYYTAGDLESNELNYCPRCGAKMDEGKDDG